jgi:hypothetical protein
VTDGFPDTPGRDATPEEEARVRALLAGLRDDDIPMPDDVWSRLSAVLAEEQASALRPTGVPAVGLGDSPDDGGAASAATAGATVSVLPDRGRRRRRSTAPRWILGAAAAVVGIALVGGLLRGMSLGSGSSTSAGAASASALGSAADLAPVNGERVSNTPYTHARLAAQASALVSGRVAFSDNTGAGVGVEASSAPPSAGTVDPASTPTAGAPLPASSTPSAEATTKASSGALLSGAALTACLVQLTGTTGSVAVAVDRGTYEGAPADVVVVPTADDPSSLDVWVVSPGCSATNADVLEFARIARP